MSVLWTSPAWSWPLLLVTAAGALVLTVRFYGQSRPHPTPGLRRVLVVLRSAALLLLLLGMAGPLLTRLVTREVPARLILVLEDSASMGLEQSAGGPSRWRKALEMADSLNASLSALNLAAEPWLARGNGLHPLRTFQQDDAVIPEPEAHGTSLGRLIAQVKAAIATEPVGAWVFLADGNETLPAAEVTSGPDAPFFVVGLGDAQGGGDRLITDLRHPETAFARDRVVVEATVVDRFASGRGDEAVEVRLLEGETVLAEQSVHLRDGAAQVALEFLPGAEGLRMLELEVSPRDNERFLANNRVSLGIDVRKARSRILVLAPRPGWDVRFLRQAAAREARLALEVVHGTAAGLAFADSLVPFVPPTSSSDWRRYEAVILVGWDALPPSLDPGLLNAAVKEGLGLLVMPTAPGLVTRVRPPAAPLAEILPVELGQARWSRGDRFVEPDSLATDHPVFTRVLAPGSVNLSAQLPPLPAALDTPLKDGARALLNARPLRGDRAGGQVLLSLWQPGQGRSAFWGGSRLWELAFWQPPRSDAPDQETSAVDRLLRNLLVWLADGTRESGLRFADRRSFYQEGESMAPAARWQDLRGLPVTDRVPTLEVRRLEPTGEPAEAPAEPMSFSSPGFDSRRQEFPFVVPALPPGRYSLRLQGAGDPPVEGQEKEIIITEHSVEKTQVRQDARCLKQLAERWQGRYLDANDPDSMSRLVGDLAALDWDGRRLSNRRQWDPTAGWPFLVVVVLLLGCEWFLRRRHGLL